MGIRERGEEVDGFVHGVQVIYTAMLDSHIQLHFTYSVSQPVEPFVLLCLSDTFYNLFWEASCLYLPDCSPRIPENCNDRKYVQRVGSHIGLHSMHVAGGSFNADKLVRRDSHWLAVASQRFSMQYLNFLLSFGKKVGEDSYNVEA